jgi:hypothetical protein
MPERKPFFGRSGQVRKMSQLGRGEEIWSGGPGLQQKKGPGKPGPSLGGTIVAQPDRAMRFFPF